MQLIAVDGKKLSNIDVNAKASAKIGKRDVNQSMRAKDSLNRLLDPEQGFLRIMVEENVDLNGLECICVLIGPGR